MHYHWLMFFTFVGLQLQLENRCSLVTMQKHAEWASLLFQVQVESNVMSELCKSVYVRQKLWRSSTRLLWTALSAAPIIRCACQVCSWNLWVCQNLSLFSSRSDAVFMRHVQQVDWSSYLQHVGNVKLFLTAESFRFLLTLMWPGQMTALVLWAVFKDTATALFQINSPFKYPRKKLKTRAEV